MVETFMVTLLPLVMNFWNVNIVDITQKLQNEFSHTIQLVILYQRNQNFCMQKAFGFALVDIFSSNFGKTTQYKNYGYK